MSDQYLEHYGVKGMEWGKKKRKPAKKQLVAPPVRSKTQIAKSSNPIMIGARLGQSVASKYKVDERMRSAVPQRLTPESFAWLKWPYVALPDSVKKQVDGIVKEAGATATSALKGEPRTAEGTKALAKLLAKKSK